MYVDLFSHINDSLPKFNPRICDGYVNEAMASKLEYIDRGWRCADEGFPPEFRYVGLRCLTPEEEFRETFGNKKKTTTEFDIAESDLVPVELKFIYTQKSPFQEIPVRKVIYVPFVREAGNLMVSGTLNTIYPVLADRVFSPTDRGIFVILNRSKFNLERLPYAIQANDETLNIYCVTTSVFNGQQNTSGSEVRHLPRSVATTGHYLFCKHGVTEAFKKYHGVDVVVTDYETAKEQYCTQEYTIYSSKFRGGFGKPIHMPKRGDYIPTQLALVIRNEDVICKPVLAILAANFFYVVDHYSDRFELTSIDQPDSWRIALGHVLHRSNESEGKLLNKVDSHLTSLDKYIDAEARLLLREEGLTVTNIYELFAHMNATIAERQNKARPGVMWGKYLLVNRYALSGITNNIFELGWAFDKEKTTISLQKIRMLLGKNIKPMAFINTRRQHGELTSVQYPGDCFLFKYTCNVIRQTNAVIPKGKRKKVISPNDESYHLDPSIAECGSYVNFPKPSPDGRTKLNPYALIDQDGMFIRNPKFIKLLDDVGVEIAKY